MATIEVPLDSAGESQEVEILDIHVKVGDQVAQGQPLVDVETDKVNVTVESPINGVVAAVCVTVGQVLPVPTGPLVMLDSA